MSAPVAPAANNPFTVLIPARMASSRLPDKPLADIAGLPMVVRVAQRAAQSAAVRVVVAADDARILQACAAHGVAAVMTRTDHASGTSATRISTPSTGGPTVSSRTWPSGCTQTKTEVSVEP